MDEVKAKESDISKAEYKFIKVLNTYKNSPAL